MMVYMVPWNGLIFLRIINKVACYTVFCTIVSYSYSNCIINLEIFQVKKQLERIIFTVKPAQCLYVLT